MLNQPSGTSKGTPKFNCLKRAKAACLMARLSASPRTRIELGCSTTWWPSTPSVHVQLPCIVKKIHIKKKSSENFNCAMFAIVRYRHVFEILSFRRDISKVCTNNISIETWQTSRNIYIVSSVWHWRTIATKTIVRKSERLFQFE